LFGLITYTARQKTKEIGIRRSLGANTGSIVGLLSREFGYLVLIANVIAWPLAWWWARHFLSRYAYHIDMPYWTYVAALGISLLIAGLTVVFKALQAAKSSPAHALRYE
jgi:putative ABC transport system permease protein